MRPGSRDGETDQGLNYFILVFAVSLCVYITGHPITLLGGGGHHDHPRFLTLF